MSHPLRKLESVRSTCSLLLKNHEKLQNFDLNLNKIDSIVTVILDLIKRDYKSVDDIKMHSRSRHMDLSKIIPTWNLDPINLAIRLMDLIVVSVLLDAGFFLLIKVPAISGLIKVFLDRRVLQLLHWIYFLQVDSLQQKIWNAILSVYQVFKFKI